MTPNITDHLTQDMETMKAIICTKYGSPEVLQVKQWVKPIPRADEVLIKVHATSVSIALRSIG